jgi:hypothetical protein
VYVQIALIGGIVLAAPFVMYQMWRLVAPVLYQQHKSFAVSFVFLTTAGFLGGALFNHYFVFRWMMAFFGSFNTNSLAFMPRLDDVFGLYTKMLFGMGLVFQMPAVVFFLAKMGLVTAFLLVNMSARFCSSSSLQCDHAQRRRRHPGVVRHADAGPLRDRPPDAWVVGSVGPSEPALPMLSDARFQISMGRAARGPASAIPSGGHNIIRKAAYVGGNASIGPTAFYNHLAMVTPLPAV